MLDKTTAPIIGRVALAALLKNSRRDWSSAFLFVFIVITIINYPYSLYVGVSGVSMIF